MLAEVMQALKKDVNSIVSALDRLPPGKEFVIEEAKQIWKPIKYNIKYATRTIPPFSMNSR
jgi:hypothetical protein